MHTRYEPDKKEDVPNLFLTRTTMRYNIKATPEAVSEYTEKAG